MNFLLIILEGALGIGKHFSPTAYKISIGKEYHKPITREVAAPWPRWMLILGNLVLVGTFTIVVDLLSIIPQLIGIFPRGFLTYSFVIEIIISQILFYFLSVISLQLVKILKKWFKVLETPWGRTFTVVLLSLIMTAPFAGIAFWIIISFLAGYIAWLVNNLSVIGFFATMMIVCGLLAYLIDGFYRKIITVPVEHREITDIVSIPPAYHKGEVDVLYVGKDAGEDLLRFPRDRVIIETDPDRATNKLIEKIDRILRLNVIEGRGRLFEYFVLLARIDDPLLPSILTSVYEFVQKNEYINFWCWLYIPKDVDYKKIKPSLQLLQNKNLSVFVIQEDSPLLKYSKSPEKKAAVALKTLLRVGPQVGMGDIREFVKGQYCTLIYSVQRRARGLIPVGDIMNRFLEDAIGNRIMLNKTYNGEKLLPIIIAPAEDLQDSDVNSSIENFFQKGDNILCEKVLRYISLDETKRACLIIANVAENDILAAISQRSENVR